MRPADYFKNHNEAALAQQIWDFAPHYDTKELMFYEGFKKLSYANQRIIRAGLLSIYVRWAASMFRDKLPALAHCGARERANVEHFWLSAMMVVIVPGGAGMPASSLMNIAYDCMISPGGKILAQNWGHDFWGSMRRSWEGIQADLEQAIGPDGGGILFATRIAVPSQEQDLTHMQFSLKNRTIKYR